MNEKNNIDHTITDEVLYQSYWNYFNLQSQQRLQMINFYVTIEVVLIGAFFTTINIFKDMRWISYVVCTAILLTSFIFWRLDVRTRYLIRWCNECILNMEKCYGNIYPDDFQLLHHSLKSNSRLKLKDTYTKCFLCYYFSVGGFAVLMIICLLTHKI